MRVCFNVMCSCRYHYKLMEYIVKEQDVAAVELYKKLKNNHHSETSNVELFELYLLHYSVTYGSMGFTTYLIKNGYDIDSVDSFGYTTLMLAFDRNDSEITQLLLAEANKDAKDCGSMIFNSFKYAVYRTSFDNSIESNDNRLDMLKKIIEQFSRDSSLGWLNIENWIVKADVHIQFALLVLGSKSIVQIVLESSYDVNYLETTSRCTALQYTMFNGNVEKVRMILSRNANVHVLDKFKNTIIYMYVKYMQNIQGSVPILEIILNRSATLFLERVQGHLKDIDWLLKRGNKETLRTVLTTQVQISETIKTTLLDFFNTRIGSNNDVNHVIASFFCLMIENEQDNVLGVVDELDFKFNANMVTHDGKTLLELAMHQCSLEKVQFLLDHGADANQSTSNGQSPLQSTITTAVEGNEENSEAIIECLLKHGADAQMVYENGRTLVDLLPHRPIKKVTIVILAHLAMLEVTQSLNGHTHNEIVSNGDLRFCFDLCVQELKAMSIVNINEITTLFLLLKQDKKRIIGYARNENFIVAFDKAFSKMKASQYYYSAMLRKKIMEIENQVKVDRSAASAIQILTGLCKDTFSRIVYQILSYMSLQDLINLSNIIQTRVP